MTPWNLLLPFFALYSTVLANTEITNFSVLKSNEVYIAEAAQWPVLRYEENEREWRIYPAPLNTPFELVCEPSILDPNGSGPTPYPHGCPHELWLILELDHKSWDAYSKFTLRISWPASFPTDFSIQLYDPEMLLTRFNGSRVLDTFDEPSTTRRRYARIRLRDTGIRTPKPHASSDKHNPIETAPVPFIVILEPLYFGVVPATVVPVILCLIPLAVLAALVVPLINTYLEGVALQARAEISGSSKEE